MGLTYETIADLLVGKYSPEKENHISTLRAYEETPIFIPVDISEDLVKLVAQTLGERRSWWYGFRTFTGMSTKVRVS